MPTEKESALVECHKIVERICSTSSRLRATNSTLEYELWWTGGLETNCCSEELCCSTPKLSLVYLIERLLELEKELNAVSDKLKTNVNKI